MADHHLRKASTEPLHSRAVTAEDILLREDPAAPAREASHRSKVTEVPHSSRVAIRLREDTLHRDTRRGISIWGKAPVSYVTMI